MHFSSNTSLLLARALRYLKRPRVIFRNRGTCPTCEREVIFTSRHTWFRDHYLCPACGSKPRERALMRALEMFFPDWQDMIIHESSPIKRGASVRLGRQCHHYTPSQLYSEVPPGTEKDGVRCENLARLTFDDASIDLHITQDVMEHVFNPDAVFHEIARTLKPGGAHVFTVPIVNKHTPSQVRSQLDDNGRIVHLMPPVYHGNPLSTDGALVTVDWGFDICQRIFDASGLFTHIVHLDDLSRGIRAEYIEVLVSIKPGAKPETPQGAAATKQR